VLRSPKKKLTIFLGRPKNKERWKFSLRDKYMCHVENVGKAFVETEAEVYTNLKLELQTK
jgi:hypothetical protein